MKKEFDICKNKIIKMINFIKKEYGVLEKKYSDDVIAKKSIPIKLSKKTNKKNRKQYEDIINQAFLPVLYSMSEMIDSNIIEWSEVSKSIELDEIKNNPNLISDLFYEGMDKLYIYKKIKYNLFFDFLMQVFLFAERELSIYIIKNYNVDKKYLTIFRGLNIIEEKEKIEIESSIKQELDLYRNIINIYKHGDGESYESVKRIRPDIINDIEGDIDMSFVMNTKKIKIDDLVSCIEKLLYDVEQKCKKL